MQKFSRLLEIDRAQVNVETGEFDLVLFTGGEASDGHILNMEGGELPSDMPLFIQHWADPVDQLGTLVPAAGRTKKEIPFRGVIEPEGVGANADIRRDLLLKMAKGHVKRMSGRWDAETKDVTRRVNLPKTHPAFIDPNEISDARQFGSFFAKWRAVEGSIVGLGADPAAVMRWARDEDTSDPVREFWLGHARDEASRAFEAATAMLIDAGLTPLEIVESLETIHAIDRNAETEVLVRIDSIEEILTGIGERIAAPREEPEPVEPERDTPAAPLPAITTDQFTDALARISDESNTRRAAMVEKKIERAQGRV